MFHVKSKFHNESKNWFSCRPSLLRQRPLSGPSRPLKRGAGEPTPPPWYYGNYLKPIWNADIASDSVTRRDFVCMGRRNDLEDFTTSNSISLILIRARRDICVHHAGVGRGAAGGRFIGGGAVGRPAHGRRVGIGGTRHRFARRRIGGAGLIFRGIVSAPGKKHQSNQGNDFFHDF